MPHTVALHALVIRHLYTRSSESFRHFPTRWFSGPCLREWLSGAWPTSRPIGRGHSGPTVFRHCSPVLRPEVLARVIRRRLGRLSALRSGDPADPFRRPVGTPSHSFRRLPHTPLQDSLFRRTGFPTTGMDYLSSLLL